MGRPRPDQGVIRSLAEIGCNGDHRPHRETVRTYTIRRGQFSVRPLRPSPSDTIDTSPRPTQ